MISEAQKRTYVSDLYSGPKWKKRVEHMDDVQVTAIYLKHNSEPSDKPVEPAPIPEPIAQPLIPRGPHCNEDEFPIY